MTAQELLNRLIDLKEEHLLDLNTLEVILPENSWGDELQLEKLVYEFQPDPSEWEFSHILRLRG